MHILCSMIYGKHQNIWEFDVCTRIFWVQVYPNILLQHQNFIQPILAQYVEWLCWYTMYVYLFDSNVSTYCIIQKYVHFVHLFLRPIAAQYLEWLFWYTKYVHLFGINVSMYCIIQKYVHFVHLFIRPIAAWYCGWFF